jgi:L-ascorbate metabolism protein UlaG (beta-lactamase superfamily)
MEAASLQAHRRCDSVLEAFTWFRQAAYRWTDGEINVYIDPWGVDEGSPPADLILITHAHHDHFQPEEIERLRVEGTRLIAPRDIAEMLPGDVTPVAPGDVADAFGIKIQVVPAYNIVEERLDKHPKAKNWVGYLMELGGHTFYHAGDTDHLPELETISTDVAFLPVGGTYTMDVPQAAELARAMKPGIAVPMHYGFVVGSVSDGEEFRKAAAPVEVQTLRPTNPFEC